MGEKEEAILFNEMPVSASDVSKLGYGVYTAFIDPADKNDADRPIVTKKAFDPILSRYVGEPYAFSFSNCTPDMMDRVRKDIAQAVADANEYLSAKYAAPKWEVVNPLIEKMEVLHQKIESCNNSDFRLDFNNNKQIKLNFSL